MRHARPDYERFQDPVGLIPEEEPVILIRGQDQAAIPAMRAWCRAHLAAGGDPAMVDLVEAHIRRVQEWQDHAYKVADLPVGTTGA